MSDNEYDESLIKEILQRHIDTAVDVFVQNIVDGIRDELSRERERILRESEKLLMETLLRRIFQAVIQYLRDIIDKVLRERLDMIQDYIASILRREISSMQYALKPSIREERILPREEEKEVEQLKRKVLELSNKLRLCQMNLANVSDRLGKFFNLMLRFEPKFHALPIIEQAGEIDIDELARILRTKKSELLEFLRITSEVGITYIHENKVRLTVPIFKSRIRGK